jgi:hypothetical protein
MKRDISIIGLVVHYIHANVVIMGITMRLHGGDFGRICVAHARYVNAQYTNLTKIGESTNDHHIRTTSRQGKIKASYEVWGHIKRLSDRQDGGI